MNINKIFRTNLIRIRKLKGLSQRKSAIKTELTQSIINSYENNPEYIPLEKLEKLAEILKIKYSIDEIAKKLRTTPETVRRYIQKYGF